MKIIVNLVLVMLIFLALAAGMSKILLLPREVEFFATYEITPWMIKSFGVLQVVGGLLMAGFRTRVIGALLVALTFLISAILLFVAGDYPLAAVTTLCVFLLIAIIKITKSDAAELRG